MAEPTPPTIPPAQAPETPPYVAVGFESLKKHLDAMPEKKTFALVLGYERSATMLPRLQIGTAWKINDVWSLAGDATIEKTAKPTTRFYTAWSW